MADLENIWRTVSNWGRWSAQNDPVGDRGTLELLRPEHLAAAAATVTDGLRISLAHDLKLHPDVEQPQPALHHMLASGDASTATGVPGYEATRDFIGTDVHGLGTTHIDALCHMFVRGQMYNGHGPESVPSSGAQQGSVMAMASGIAGRGVLLDVPAALGVEYLEPDHAVTVAELELAEERTGVRGRRG